MVSHIILCYGISRCPFTNEFIVVTSYAEDGDLRQYISKNFDNFTLQKKIIALKDIASGLVTIHKAGLLHVMASFMIIVKESLLCTNNN